LKIFLISSLKFFKLIFLKSPAKSIANATFYFFKYVLVLFLRSCLYSESLFLKRHYGLAEIHRSSFLFKIYKIYYIETCQIVKPTHPPFKIYFIQLIKKNIFFDVPKLWFFIVFFSNFSILT
jgi:hypothetical protein